MNLTCRSYDREYSRLISKKLKGKSLRIKHNFITPRYTRDNRMRCLMKTQIFDWNICWFDWTWNAANDLWILLFPRDRCALSALAFYAYAKDHVSSLFRLLIQNNITLLLSPLYMQFNGDLSEKISNHPSWSTIIRSVTLRTIIGR